MTQDNYGGLCDWWPKVTEYSGVQIYLDNERGNFVAKLEEEHFVSSATLEGVKEKIDRALSFKEKSKKEKLDPIPVVRISKSSTLDRFTGKDILEDVKIVSLHAGNGNAIIQDAKGKKHQISWGYSEFLKPLTPEEKEEYARLDKARREADKKFEEFHDKFLIRGKVDAYAREVWKLPAAKE